MCIEQRMGGIVNSELAFRHRSTLETGSMAIGSGLGAGFSMLRVVDSIWMCQ